MKIKLDKIVYLELKEYLLSQDGITYVDINYDGYYIEVNVKYNKKTNLILVMKYIELFQNYKSSCLVEFDKEYEESTKTLKYIIKDMCCEHCYNALVMNLFENNKVKSVKSNFDIEKGFFNIEFIIEYIKDYKEQDLIKYIKEKCSCQ